MEVPSMKASIDRQVEAPAGSGSRHLPLLQTPLQGPYTAMYGSDVVAARYCGFRKSPSPPLGLWMHGWYPETRSLDRPERLFDVTMANLREEQYWVTTERQAKFLRRLGFPRSTPIGLPLVYVPKPAVARERDSLLVMPAHSLPASDRARGTSDYVASISALKSTFRRICVCINAHDWIWGNWVHEFQTAGFEVIRGAGDISSLEHMASLFSQYEFVTTNGFGSLIAYASAFGAKASFYGPFSEVSIDSLKNVSFFIDNPDLRSVEVKCLEESYCREMFPEFFCHPAEARERVEWGRAEIGWQNKVPPDELRHLFGWSALGRATSTLRTLGRRSQAIVSEPLKSRLKEMLMPELRNERGERRRLESMDADVLGTTPLFGEAFAFVDARTYLQTYDDCFVKHAYRFRATSERPFIIDGHADLGLAVLYFKCLYPRSRILALEAEPKAFEVLARNCRSYELDDVELVRGVLSIDVLADALLSHARANAEEGDRDEAGHSVVPPFRFGSELVERIDLLKLRVEASRTGRVLEMSALLPNVESVAVDYRAQAGEPQNLGPLIDVLERAGFRIAVQSPDSTRTRPLVEIPSAGFRDNNLRILGFRI
jgi:hypothetical protein